MRKIVRKELDHDTRRKGNKSMNGERQIVSRVTTLCIHYAGDEHLT
jgi:hypothetical protein